MNLKQLPTRVLLEYLAEGWSRSHYGVAQEFIARLGSALGADFQLSTVGDDTLAFTLDLGNIRLRGMDSVPCLLLADADPESCAHELRVQPLNRGLPFVLAVTETALRRAEKALPGNRRLILSKEDLLLLCTAPDATQQLKQLIWQRIPQKMLVPYNILRPAEGNMFFGRMHELKRFCEEEFTSFAIVGPSRIGKTSLVRRYREEMVRRRDPRSASRFYISFYDCQDVTADGVARFLAMAVDPSSRSAKLTHDGLVKFILYYCRNFGSPLDLLLDEVDVVCESGAFGILGEAARAGMCRFILCGRGALLRTLLSNRSSLQARLDMIQLGALEEGAARDLLLQPLIDINFKIEEADELTRLVLSFTGRLPYFIQYIGGRLAGIAMGEKTDIISIGHFETLKADFTTPLYFLMPLNNLDEPIMRLVALLLLREEPRSFSVASVKELAEGVGVELDHPRVVSICNDLVINNILSWSGGEYCVANDGLYYYARKMGYLTSALDEALRSVTTPG